MSYHTTNFHTDAKTPVEHQQWTGADGAPTKGVRLGEIMDGVTLFLVPESAAALHKALEQLYPELAAASESPTEVVMHYSSKPKSLWGDLTPTIQAAQEEAAVNRYADSHAHEVAPTEDDEIAAMVAELADSHNARKFGSTGATNPT